MNDQVLSSESVVQGRVEEVSPMAVCCADDDETKTSSPKNKQQKSGDDRSRKRSLKKTHSVGSLLPSVTNSRDKKLVSERRIKRTHSVDQFEISPAVATSEDYNSPKVSLTKEKKSKRDQMGSRKKNESDVQRKTDCEDVDLSKHEKASKTDDKDRMIKTDHSVDFDGSKNSSKEEKSRRRRLKKGNSAECFGLNCGEEAVGSEDQAIESDGSKKSSNEEKSRRRRLKKSNSVDCIVLNCAEAVGSGKHAIESDGCKKRSKEEKSRHRRLKKSSSAECIVLDYGEEAVRSGDQAIESDGSKKRSRRRRLKKSNSVDCIVLDYDDEDVGPEAEKKITKERKSKERTLTKSYSVDHMNATWNGDSNETSSAASQKKVEKSVDSPDEAPILNDSKLDRSRRRRLKKTHSVDCLEVEFPSREVSTNKDGGSPDKKKKTKIKKQSSSHVGLGGSSPHEVEESDNDKVMTRDGVMKKTAQLKKSLSVGCVVDDDVEEAVCKGQIANISKIREKVKKKKKKEDRHKGSKKEKTKSLENDVHSECEKISCEPKEELATDDIPTTIVAKNKSVSSPNRNSNAQDKKVFAIEERVKSTDLPAKMGFAEAFAQVRGNHRTMQNLDLGGVHLTTAQCSAFSMALKDNWFLKELHLVDVGVGPALGMILSHGVKQNKTLERLYLQSNNLGDSGTEALASAMAENNRISLLNLARNDIGDIGAAALAEVLSSRKREDGGLKRLYLYENRIQDLGAEALSVLIACNTSLEEVYVWENKFKAKGLADLTEAVKLRYNSIPPKPIHLRVSWKTNIR